MTLLPEQQRGLANVRDRSQPRPVRSDGAAWVHGIAQDQLPRATGCSRHDGTSEAQEHHRRNGAQSEAQTN